MNKNTMDKELGAALEPRIENHAALKAAYTGLRRMYPELGLTPWEDLTAEEKLDRAELLFLWQETLHLERENQMRETHLRELEMFRRK
jgi:hypothetical protein